MSLLDAVNELKKNGFNPKEGKEYNPNERIPDGEYLVSLDGVTHNAKNDRDFLLIVFKVVNGEFADRTESWFPTLAQTTAQGKPMPTFVLSKNIASLQLLGEALDNPIDDSNFAHESETDAYEDLEGAFRPAVGKLLKLTITSKPNKKNPDYPFINYKFDKAEQPKAVEPVEENIAPVSRDPFANRETVEIDDSQFPF